jgi:hypothetical protein
MFLSFTHQPLTIPFVYASPWRLATHRRLFLWSPLAVLSVVAVSSRLSLVLVALVGALWNAEHTLMQRYGLVRIYGRRAGDDQGLLEKCMLIAWFLIPLLWVTARGEIDGTASRFGAATVDSSAATILAHLSVQARAILPFALIATGCLTARWFAVERRSGRSNPAKWTYLASTGALFLVAVVDPLAGLIGFVGSHAIEYFVVVNRSVVGEASHPGALGAISRLPRGPALFLTVYLASATGLFLVLYNLAPTRVFLVSALTIGALHFFYDSFIWKLRKPAVAASLAPARRPLVMG